MRSEAFIFPLIHRDAGKLPGGRWVDPSVLDDAIGDIAVAALKAAAVSARPEDTEQAAAALDSVVDARRALMRLVDDAIRPTHRP